MFIVLAFTDSLEALSNISLPGGFRQLLIFLFASLIIARGKIRISYWTLIVIVGLFVAQIPNNYGVPIINKSLGYLMTIQGIILFIVFSSLQIEEKQVLKLYRRVILLCFTMAIWAFASYLFTDFGSPMRGNYGLFREAGAFASAMVVSISLSLTQYIHTRKLIWLNIAIILTLIIFLTILKKNIISVAILWMLFGFFYTRKAENRLLFTISVGLAGGAFFVLFSNLLLQNFSENINYLGRVGVESHVRLGMYLIAFELALNAFPLGTGAGSFGSLASILGFYSPLYEISGASLLGANSLADIERGSHTILDTFWPHVMAEYGLTGLILYISLLFHIIGKTENRRNRVQSIMIVFVMCWEGLWLYNPETPVFVFLYWSILGLNARNQSNQIERGSINAI